MENQTRLKEPAPAAPPAVRYASSLCAILASVSTFFTVILLTVAWNATRAAYAAFALAITILLWIAASHLRRRRRTGAIAACLGLLGFAVPLIVTPVDPSIRYGFLTLEAAAVFFIARSWRHLHTKSVGA